MRPLLYLVGCRPGEDGFCVWALAPLLCDFTSLILVGSPQSLCSPHTSHDSPRAGCLPPASSVDSHDPGETSLPSAMLSDEKSREILNLVEDMLNRTDHAPVAEYKDSLVWGARSRDFNMMSRKTMETYLVNYWRGFHAQLPICKSRISSTSKRLALGLPRMCRTSISPRHGKGVSPASRQTGRPRQGGREELTVG